MSKPSYKTLMARAEAALSKAVQAESAERSSTPELVRLYEAGLALLLKAIKACPSEPRRQQLRQRMAQYLQHAEALKQGQVNAPQASKRKAKKPGKRAGGPAASARRALSRDSAAIRSIETRYVDAIEREVVDDIDESSVRFDDIAGLEDVKQALYEMVVFPTLRPDLFTGLRTPPRGLLMYGPPGNGKTMIARATAAQANAVFFNISASSLVSRYMGDGEKLVRALFAVARANQPAIIFIDEIDSILGARSSDEHEASRRLKTEFMVQFNALLENSGPDDEVEQVVVIGATNIPEQLDDAVIRRLSKRIYVGVPDADTRLALITSLLAKNARDGDHKGHSLSKREMSELVRRTQGYSGSDLRALCQEAAMGPVRDLGMSNVVRVGSADDIDAIQWKHFDEALLVVPPSVTPERLQQYAAFHERHSRQNSEQAKAAAQARRERYRREEEERRRQRKPQGKKNKKKKPETVQRNGQSCTTS